MRQAHQPTTDNVSPHSSLEAPLSARKLAFIVTITLLIVGCGGSDGPKPKRLTVQSTAIDSENRIASRYHCEEGAVWFPIEWSNAPREATEFVVVVGVNRLKKRGRATEARLAGEWFIAGLDFSQRRLKPGLPPDGAFLALHRPRVGTLCPRGTKTIDLVATVYAMPFGHEFRSQDSTGGVGTIEALNDTAIGIGSLPVSYRSH